MKISFNPTTKVQVIIPGDNDRIVQNSSGNKVYLYGIEAGWEVKATFTRRDGFQIGLIGGIYDLDPDDEYCYVIPIPEKATEVDKGLGLSILIYEPSGATFIRHSTIATSMYVYSSSNVIVPEDLDTVLYDAVMLAISNLTANKLEHSAIVGISGEITSKDTAIYSKQKIDELDTVIVLNINTHKARTDNPHSTTKAQVGLGNADDTSDVNKPVSIAQAAALALKENLANKRTSWNTTPSNTSYPSEKLTKDSLDLKVDKALTILGIDLANDISRAEFVAALGNATTLLDGLMSATDKARLDALHALLGTTADADAVVNTINEILAVFANYPEGVDLVTALAGKVDKVTGKGLSTNDYTTAEQSKVSHLPANFTTFMGDYYTKSEVLVLLDQLTSAYGLTETEITELAHNATILLSAVTGYDYITLYLKHTDTHLIFDGKLIDPALFVNDGDFIQLNAWEDGVQKTFGKLTFNGTTTLTFTGANATDTLVVKGYKKDPVSSNLVVTAHTGTNYLDEAETVHEGLEALDTQSKANADAILTNKESADLSLADHSQRLDETEETLRKALNSDGTATADDDGTGIIAMGKDVAPAPLKVLVEGLLLNAPQLVTNGGNPFTVTTGWSPYTNYTSLNVVSNILEATVINNQNLFIASSISPIAIGQKVYVATELKSSISITDLNLGLKTTIGGTTALSLGNLTVGTVYTKYSFIGTTATYLANYLQFYSEQLTTTDDKLSIVYAYSFNITTLIANKQYSPLYSTTFDLMSDAQIKAQMDLWVLNGTLPRSINAVNMNKRLRATGKNLFDKGKYATSYAYKIKVKPSTAYVWSASTAYKTYDINMVELVSATGTTVTTGASAYYIAFTAIASADTFQLELGTVATTYEPYKHSDMFLKGDSVGYSLPNSVKDSIEQRDGKLYRVQKVQRYVLQASDINSIAVFATPEPDIQAVVFKKKLDFIGYNKSGNVAYSQAHYISGFNSDGSGTVGSIFEWSFTEMAIGFILGTYVNLAAAQAALAGTVIYYQLATPVTTEIASSGILNGYALGHIYIDDIIKDADVYTTSISITDTDWPIVALESIVKLNVDGSQTELAVSSATIAGDGLSFTHTGLTAGDIVVFTYRYGTGLRGLTTVTYYDDPMIVAGSGTTAGKVYKIVPTVVDANIVWTKVEV